MNGDLFAQLVSGGFTILLAILTYVIFPWVRERVSAEKLKRILSIVKMAVNAVQQMFEDIELTNPEKKQYALQYIRTLGVKINDAQLDALIEAMVYQMKLESKDKVPDLPIQ